jgi:hypothetical protein
MSGLYGDCGACVDYSHKLGSVWLTMMLWLKFLIKILARRSTSSEFHDTVSFLTRHRQNRTTTPALLLLYYCNPGAEHIARRRELV